MRPEEYEAFVVEFRRLSRALERFPQGVSELRDRADAYFHALKNLPLAALVAKADGWIQTETKFPKPAEWARVHQPQTLSLVPTLTNEEAHEYVRAEGLGYEDAPCSCAACGEAGVQEKPIRFMPELTAEDRDRKVMCWARMVTAGHWAHGWELARWYLARDAFWAKCCALGLRGDVLTVGPKVRRTFQERMATIFPIRDVKQRAAGDREPGCDDA